MSAHAERVYPEECCGLMLGKMRSQSDPVQKQLVRLEPLKNEWTEEALDQLDSSGQALTKRRRYWIDPKEMLRVQREARDEGLNIIGVYHSHPNHVSVCEGKAVDVQNWALDSEHQFQPEPMTVSPSSATARMPVSA